MRVDGGGGWACLDGYVKPGTWASTHLECVGLGGTGGVDQNKMLSVTEEGCEGEDGV